MKYINISLKDMFKRNVPGKRFYYARAQNMLNLNNHFRGGGKQFYVYFPTENSK